MSDQSAATHGDRKGTGGLRRMASVNLRRFREQLGQAIAPPQADTVFSGELQQHLRGGAAPVLTRLPDGVGASVEFLSANRLAVHIASPEFSDKPFHLTVRSTRPEHAAGGEEVLLGFQIDSGPGRDLGEAVFYFPLRARFTPQQNFGLLADFVRLRSIDGRSRDLPPLPARAPYR